jgi:hypothetical protein
MIQQNFKMFIMDVYFICLIVEGFIFLGGFFVFNFNIKSLFLNLLYEINILWEI